MVLSSWSIAAPAVGAAFLASLVEVVEAFTIVLAVGTIRGWRPAALGALGPRLGARPWRELEAPDLDAAAGARPAQVLDLPWQEDDPAHWERAATAAAVGRVMLAGGLGPENVADAIAAVRPWAVDASSSLEVSPGIKDHEKVRAYVKAARA